MRLFCLRMYYFHLRSFYIYQQGLRSDFIVYFFILLFGEKPPPPQWVSVCTFTRFLDHTQLLWTSDQLVAETSTCNTQHSQQTSMYPVGFEPTISASERPQNYPLDRAATGTGNFSFRYFKT